MPTKPLYRRTNSQTADGSDPSRALPRHGIGSDNSVGVHNLDIVATQIVQAASGLQKDLQQNVALAKLKQYLDTLHSEAVSVINQHHAPQLLGRRRDACLSVGETHDSAIDMSYDEASFRPGKQTARRSPQDVQPSSWEKALDEFDGELNEMPTEEPAFSPKSAARLGSSRATSVSAPSPRPSTAGSASYGTGIAARMTDSPGQSYSSVPPARPAHQRHLGGGFYRTPVTELSHQARDNLSPCETRSNSRRDSIFGQLSHPIWENPRTEVPAPARPIMSSSITHWQQQQRHSDHHGHAGAPRRSSSKLSKTLRSLTFRRSSAETVDDKLGSGSAAVFGVPLAQSIKVAKGIASTRHASGGGSAHTTRDYPLCVLRCVYYIRDRGLEAPDIFGLDGDRLRVAQLRETFNSPETSYGKELDWSHFSVYDAADLILLFLSELPSPLISESVGKRWVSLSRQATVRGSLAVRLDQGIDFWEEALLGVHGPARTLFKLLLSLWGDIADAAEVNDMTAERLAGRVVLPLMHVTAHRHQTDFTLGLAFMIRKRSEYNLAAKAVGQKS